MARPGAKRLIVIIGFVLLLCATVVVFMQFDRNSHSASDTLRPFILTMAPVWLIAVAAARAWGSSKTPHV